MFVWSFLYVWFSIMILGILLFKRLSVGESWVLELISQLHDSIESERKHYFNSNSKSRLNCFWKDFHLANWHSFLTLTRFILMKRGLFEKEYKILYFKEKLVIDLFSTELWSKLFSVLAKFGGVEMHSRIKKITPEI